MGRGYVLSVDEPIRVYPAASGRSMSGAHAGGWRPGVISLRENPQGLAGPEIILRHELMHEASHQTCGNRLPLWAEEAAAISFSGELALDPQAFAESPSEEAISRLRQRLTRGTRLDSETYATLARLVVTHGWPSEPCAIAKALDQQLAKAAQPEPEGLSGILIHLASGRVVESKGDMKSTYPPGSLLKIPYVAALKDDASRLLGEELARSDTEALLQRRDRLDLDRYRFLLAPVGDAPLAEPLALDDPRRQSPQFWHRYIGERDADGSFPLEATLPELARILRTALLYKPEPFLGLSRNGSLEGSTLRSQPEGERRMLKNLHALAKTGTVTDIRNTPLIGHLMVAWPAARPVYLAVFRSFGVRGAAVLGRASGLLGEWAARHPLPLASVRVRLLSLTPRETWEIQDESPTFERPLADGARLRVSSDGLFGIVSSARNSRLKRQVQGILHTSADGQTVVLETDTMSYVEAVLAAEAEDLPPEGRRAMAAVIAYNGSHGSHRHPASRSLCDSTHCMVFLGAPERQDLARKTVIDSTLLALLDKKAATGGEKWLAFSKGGAERWQRRLTFTDLQRLAGEPGVLDLRRERLRSGDVIIRLVYLESEEQVPCETFRNRFKLLSCPESIRVDPDGGGWSLSGIGEGHGQGLSVERARILADAGQDAAAILADAYGSGRE